MALTFGRSVKKADVGDFCQKMAMLLETGYDATAAVELLGATPEDKKRGDHSADGIRRVANLLLPPLHEGFTLHEAMDTDRARKFFGPYINQVEVGEASGKTAEVMQRIYDQIKNANKIMSKLRGALAYPLFTLVFTFGAAGYLFTAVIPDMLNMLAEVGVGELPSTTKLVMAIGTWFKSNGLFLLTLILILIVFLVVYSKTIGKATMSRILTGVPFLGKVVQNNAMTMFFRSWEQMIEAGAEMSVALKSASEAISNLYIQRCMRDAQREYMENGIPVYEAIRPVFCVRELEIQTIQVALEGDKLAKTLKILGDDREFEATKSINKMTTAINPIMMIIVGIVVAILVLSVYQPIISVSSSLT